MSLAAEVERHSHYDDEAAALLSANEYNREEFELHLSKGAQWFALRERGHQVSICMVFENFRDIWEVGGVFTVPEYRRMGCARAVVAAALDFLSERDVTPRHQFHYRNTASQEVAESFGLQLGLTVDHLVNYE